MRGRAGQCLPTYKGVPHNADKVCSKAAARMKVGHRLNAHPQKKTLKKDRPSENKLRLSFLPYVPISLKREWGEGESSTTRLLPISFTSKDFHRLDIDQVFNFFVYSRGKL